MMKTAMEMKILSLAAIAILSSIDLALAANHTVGGPNGGWDQSTDLATWASSQSFSAGDNLIFQYTSNHDVTEVSEADFDSCTATNPLQPPFSGGFTVIPLTSAGTRYFICGTPGHCLGGMKVQIDILAAAAPPPSTTPSLPPPPATTPTVPSPPPTPSARPPVSSPPPKSTAPSPASEVSPSSPPIKAAASNPPPMPPAAATPPSDSLSPPPPPGPSSAAKSNLMGALTVACSGFLVVLF